MKYNKQVQISLQAGYIIIELMIVIAIRGILAFLTISTYQEYSIRIRASEPYLLSNSMTSFSE